MVRVRVRVMAKLGFVGAVVFLVFLGKLLASDLNGVQAHDMVRLKAAVGSGVRVRALVKVRVRVRVKIIVKVKVRVKIGVEAASRMLRLECRLSMLTHKGVP